MPRIDCRLLSVDDLPRREIALFNAGCTRDPTRPVWLLWIVGLIIPVVELVAVWLLVVGVRVRGSLIAVGIVLVTVTYGDLLKESLYSFTDHVIARLGLLVVVALLADEDRFSVDRWRQDRQ